MNSKKIKIFCFLIFFFNFFNVNSFENKILFKVDNEIITTIDLYNQRNYLIAFNKDLEKLDKNKILDIAKNSLIKEKIKTKEISKYTKNLILEKKFLDKFVENIYLNLNLDSLENFINYLDQYNITIEYVNNKISIDVIWNDLIFSKFSNKVKIDANEIRENLKKNISKNSKEYLLSEIIFNIPKNSNYKSKFQEIENDIFEKGFENSVLIHSISNTSAKNSGKIGWVNENSMDIKIKKILDDLNIGEHSKPITLPGGFLILKINDIKIVENKNYDIEKAVNEIIKSKTNEQLNNYSNIYFNKIQKEFIINDQL